MMLTIKNHCNSNFSVLFIAKQFDIVPHLPYCSSQISHSPSLTFARNNRVEVLEIYTNNNIIQQAMSRNERLYLYDLLGWEGLR